MRVRALDAARGSASIAPPIVVGGDGQATEADVPGLGSIGNRPALTAKPTAADTGPRQAATRTLSGSAALAEVLSAPVEADGKRYLRRTRINGSITLDKAAHSGLVFEDCIIEGGWAPYALKAQLFTGIQPAVWPEFRYCEISQGTSATVAGGYIRLLRCDISAGNDLLKPFTGMEVYASYLHGTWHTSGAHCDVFQITNGASGSLFHWNTMDAFNHPASPDGSGGEPANAVLQTGSQNGDVGLVEWRHNWFNGGGYTIRGRKDTDTQYAADYLFRGNRFGRNFRFGPLQNNGYAGFDFDTSNVWDDTGLPVGG